MKEEIRPLYARLRAKDELVSEATGIHYYRVGFYVKFNDGHVDEITFNTTQDYQKLTSTEKINGIFSKPVDLSPWQHMLFDCWKKTENIAATRLYTFRESECVTSPASNDVLEAIFFVPEPKSWCPIL